MPTSIAIPRTMTAYRFKPSVGRPVAETVNVPAPTSDEVLIKILAGGVCHSDLGILEVGSALHTQMSGFTAGFTLGHEGAGIIVSRGADVASTHPELTLGSYVAVYTINSCFSADCYNCTHGMENRCPRGNETAYGLGADGSWAAYAAIRAACVVRVPGNPTQISPGVVSTATDAMLTPYHAMAACCGLRPEHTVLCVGIGGLGYNAIAIAKRLLGVRRLVAVDTRAAALELAREAGADVVATPDTLLRTLEDAHLVVDFAFDFVGAQATFDLCFEAVRCGGTVHVVGLAVGALDAPPLRLMTKELTYKTSFYGTKHELGTVLRAIADGVLAPRVEMRPMSEVARVLEDMHAGKLTSRVALSPQENAGAEAMRAKL